MRMAEQKRRPYIWGNEKVKFGNKGIDKSMESNDHSEVLFLVLKCSLYLDQIFNYFANPSKARTVF